jgi:alpha-1,3-rhamnosyl/mannosyltransferase
LSTLKFPKFHPAARVDFVNKAIKYAIEHADHIITDSEFVKNEIIDFFGTEKHKVTAISLAADASFYPRQAAECEDIAKEYGLAYKEFFLFISTLEPRKNLLILLDAFCLYRQKHPSGLPLVIVGGNGWNNKSILRKIKSMEVNGWVKYVGYTRQEVVPQFYSAAKALLFPSIYEGFGLPVLEAMKSAIPVLTSKNSSMSEITLDSALLVDIDDIEGMSLLISELSTNQELCDILSIKGRERAKAFSWERCAKETMDVYRSLSENITYW